LTIYFWKYSILVFV